MPPFTSMIFPARFKPPCFVRGFQTSHVWLPESNGYHRICVLFWSILCSASLPGTWAKHWLNALGITELWIIWVCLKMGGIPPMCCQVKYVDSKTIGLGFPTISHWDPCHTILVGCIHCVQYPISIQFIAIVSPLSLSVMINSQFGGFYSTYFKSQIDNDSIW